MTAARDLAWDGCLNVRDLGGHATEDGRETRFGAVVRADSRGRLTDAGWEALVGYGVSRIVDLRYHEELEADPPRELPVEVVHVPLLDRIDEAGWRRLDELASAAPTAAEATAAVYDTWLDRCRVRFAEALDAVAGAGDGAVVVHCVGGKDRTGLVTALLLRLCAVPVDAIACDYAETAANLRPLHESWIAEAEDERERLRREWIAATPAPAMRAVLDALERRHGSVAGYLEASGAAATTAGRVRERLLAP